MKISEELTAIKMSIRTLSAKIKRIENVNKKLKKQVLVNNPSGEISQPVKSKAEFFNGYDIERRMRNLISPEQLK